MVLCWGIHSLLYSFAVTLFFTIEKCLNKLAPRFLDHPKYSGYFLFHNMPLCLRVLNVTLNRVEKFGHLWIGSLVVHVSGWHKAFALSDLVLPWNILIRDWLAKVFVLLTRRLMLTMFECAVFLSKILSQDSLRNLPLLVGLIQIVVEWLLFTIVDKVVLILLILVL